MLLRGKLRTVRQTAWDRRTAAGINKSLRKTAIRPKPMMLMTRRRTKQRMQRLRIRQRLMKAGGKKKNSPNPKTWCA